MSAIHIIPPQELYDFLKENNILELFHANTLHTSCVFLREEYLVSRQAIEIGPYSQTEQKSDAIDKVYGIYNDIFLDSTDICSRANYPNEYGPILFEVSTDILLDPSIISCKITKFNPTKWKGLDTENRYLKYDEYKEKFSYGTFDHMITLQTYTGKVPLPPFLKRITIDGPEILSFKEISIDTYSYARGAIKFAIFQKENYNHDYVKRSNNHLNDCYAQISKDEILKRFNAYYVK